MQEHKKRARFEQTVLPHVRAGYNLARWLTGSDQDAEDMVQEACVRAFRFLDGFHGDDGRAWLLTIVRRTCYTWLRQNRAHELLVPLDEEIHDSPSNTFNPETMLLQRAESQRLRHAVEQLPAEFREVVVLRELEGLSYKEIADIADVPLGTVMSRLARARKRLQRALVSRRNEGFGIEL